MPTDEFNPYSAPTSADPSGVPPEVIDPEAEAIRREHIGRESTVKAIGMGCYLVVFFMGLYAIAALGVSITIFNEPGPWPGQSDTRMVRGLIFAVSAPALAALTAWTFALARGLRRLRPGARRGSLVLLATLLLILTCLVVAGSILAPSRRAPAVACAWAVVLSTIFWLLMSAKVRTIFTPEYHDIVAMTPHIKYRSSRRFKVALLIALSMILLLIAVGVLINGNK